MRYIWCTYLAAFISFQSLHLCYASENVNDIDDAQWESYNYNQADDDVEFDWYFDDPYFSFPSDDAAVVDMKESLKAHREEEQRIYDEKKEYIIQLITAGSCTLFGLILGTFCTSVLLYYAKKTRLMIRYDSEGALIEANILASEPNIEEMVKNDSTISSRKEIKTLTTKSSDENSEPVINDSYSIMSDDETNYASYSSSKGSSSSESIAAAVDDDEWQQNVINMKGVATTQRIKRKLPNEKTKQIDFNTVWKAVDQQQPLLSTQRVVVVVEYRTEEAPHRFRKRLIIMGNDVQVSESRGIVKKQVLLYVLKGSPKSGQCCGGIHRALNWKMQLSFFFILSLFIVLTVATFVASSKLLSRNLFFAYLAVFLLLVILQIIFLDAAIANIVSKQYLEDGRVFPAYVKLNNASFEKKELDMALKHGTSSFV